MKLKCKCGYEWQTKSRMMLVSCPCCSKKIKVRDRYVKESSEKPLTKVPVVMTNE